MLMAINLGTISNPVSRLLFYRFLLGIGFGVVLVHAGLSWWWAPVFTSLICVRGVLPRTYATFGLTDEAYALTGGPQAQTWTTRRIVVLQLLLQLFWVSGATVGALAGTRLPLDRLQGLDFALTALFVVLAIEAYRATRDLRTAGLAVLCAVAAQGAFPQQMLLVALTLFAGLLVARAALAGGRPADA
jgi:predicted branched-subunit amino acid permease